MWSANLGLIGEIEPAVLLNVLDALGLSSAQPRHPGACMYMHPAGTHCSRLVCMLHFVVFIFGGR